MESAWSCTGITNICPKYKIKNSNFSYCNFCVCKWNIILINISLSLKKSVFLYFADLPFNLLVKGKFNQTVPAMIGVTQNEGGYDVIPLKGSYV